VIKPDIYDPTLNRAYAEMERHYGFVADGNDNPKLTTCDNLILTTPEHG
jgi:hypothetical protein